MEKASLLDTNTISSIINNNKTERANAAINSFLANNELIFITDFAFIELVEGRNNLSEYNKLMDFILNYSISICGHSTFLNKYANDALNKGFKSDAEFLTFKENVTKTKFDFVKDYYAEMLIRYVVILATVLSYIDNDYFSPVLPHIINLFKNGMDIIKKECFEILEAIYKKELESDNLLYDCSVLLIDVLFSMYKPQYKELEVYDKVEKMDVKTKLSTMTSNVIKKLKFKAEYKSFSNYNNELFLLALMKHNRKFVSLEDEVLNDAMTYSVIKSGFCQGKFQKNDLVDIYNLSYSMNVSKYSFTYHTEEKKWVEFAEIEKYLVPDILNHFSKNY